MVPVHRIGNNQQDNTRLGSFLFFFQFQPHVYAGTMLLHTLITVFPAMTSDNFRHISRSSSDSVECKLIQDTSTDKYIYLFISSSQLVSNKDN